MCGTHEFQMQHWIKKIACIYRAMSDPGVPWYVKVIALMLVAYVLSPVDLIPDFIPVLGLLDEAVIIPAGIALIMKLIPDQVLAGIEENADSEPFDGNNK